MRAVVVTTEHKGVFFGYLDPSTDITASTLSLTRARMCVYWSEDVRGVLGLAVGGPSNQCRITKAVDRILLNGITSVMDASVKAVEKWEAEPWKE